MAIHEAAHVVIGLATGFATVQSAAVSPYMVGHMGTGGYTEFRERTSTMKTRQGYISQILTYLAGTAAEEVIVGNRSDGAIGDLQSCTILAGMLECSLGLGYGLALLSDIDSSNVLSLLRMDPRLRGRVNELLAACFEQTKELVQQKRSDIERLADALQQRLRLNESEIAAILNRPRLELVRATIH
jgi:ATP-dependent Zn protease